MAFNCWTPTRGFSEKPSCVANVTTSFFQAKQQVERDVQEVAAAASGIEDDDGGEPFLELCQPVAVRRDAFAFDVSRSKLALQLAPLPPERLHENGLDEGFDVGFAGVVSAELGALIFVEGAFEERAHDAGFNELPVGFAGGGELAQFGFGEFKDAGFLKEVAVEMTNFVFAKGAAGGHDGEQLFERLGKELRIVNPGLGNFRKKMFWQQAGVLGKETKDDAIQKTGDAKIFLLRDVHFL